MDDERPAAEENSTRSAGDWLALMLFVGVCLGAGGLGAMATTPEIDGWYRTIERPAWSPPDWVFGPVWTTLYVLMGIAAWLVWRLGAQSRNIGPSRLFVIQLILNIAWSWIFFARHEIGWAAVEIVVLWLAIVATTIAFFRRSRIAGWLLVPYLAWVTFASYLNFTLWQLNKG
ncbi:MAG: TspO/MBR family protein [Planctomycetaceae bacterium]